MCIHPQVLESCASCEQESPFEPHDASLKSVALENDADFCREWKKQVVPRQEWQDPFPTPSLLFSPLYFAQMENTVDQVAPVRIIRLDQGKSDERGDYRCAECGWENRNVVASCPKEHAKRQHPWRPVKTERLVAKPLKEDRDAINARNRAMAYRARKKVRPAESEQYRGRRVRVLEY